MDGTFFHTLNGYGFHLHAHTAYKHACIWRERDTRTFIFKQEVLAFH
jgi:hypothetical protein